MHDSPSQEPQRSKRATAWGWWALTGCFIWIFAMLMIDWPIGLLLTPAGGPLCGWALGGVFALLFGERG